VTNSRYVPPYVVAGQDVLAGYDQPQSVSIAAMPDEAAAEAATLSSARHASSAARVGLPVRAYS
jgi:hypothetical protein